VDELHAGITYKKSITERLNTEWSAGYKTGSENWGYSARIDYKFGKQKNTTVAVSYEDDTNRQFQSQNYSKLTASLLPLLGTNDYFDYYRNKRLRTELQHGFDRADMILKIGFNNESHSDLNRTSNYNIVNSDKNQRQNRVIKAGQLRSVDFTISYGDVRAPFGVVGQRRIELKMEHSAEKLISSDFNFTQYILNIDWHINTFLKRRLLPNSLDVRLLFSTTSGKLPVQKYYGLDGNLFVFSPYGTFRSLAGKHYSGEDVAALFWEHNFRTVPFELIGLDYLARKGLSIIVYGGHGRTWLDHNERFTGLNTTKNWHHEAGMSLNSLFGILRLDVTRRLDRPGYYVGVSFARFF
jgi:hypothetical protein